MSDMTATKESQYPICPSCGEATLTPVSSDSMGEGASLVSFTCSNCGRQVTGVGLSCHSSMTLSSSM